MKRKFLVIPAVCLALAFGCDSDRRTAQGDGYQETDGLNEAEYAEGIDEANRDESLGGEGSFDVETERTSAPGTEEDTREFLEEAASTNMMEVELAQLAQERAQSQQVKDFATKMANDHQQANQSLQSVAQQKNMNLPQNLTEEHREKMNDKMEDLREKSGNEFDKEFMDMQVEMHEKKIDKFEDKQESVQDPEIKQWVENTLASMRQHKEEAQIIKEQVDTNSGSTTNSSNNNANTNNNQ